MLISEPPSGGSSRESEGESEGRKKKEKNTGRVQAEREVAKLLQKALEGVLSAPDARALETGIDVIGDIAIVKLDESVKDQGSLVGDAILRSMKNVKAVFDQEGGLEGDFRLRTLRHIAGDQRTLTTHKENGLRFQVDVQTCYFSPRLSTERLRVVDMTQPDDLVLNMFAGVGPYSNTLSRKKGVTVYSNELNASAFELHHVNNRMNKVERLTRMSNLDASKLPEVVEPKLFDRILMPHPSQANRFLSIAVGLTKPGGWIHYYRHISARDYGEAEKELRREVRGIIGTNSRQLETRRVREIGPRYLELAADIQVTA